MHSGQSSNKFTPRAYQATGHKKYITMFKMLYFFNFCYFYHRRSGAGRDLLHRAARGRRHHRPHLPRRQTTAQTLHELGTNSLRGDARQYCVQLALGDDQLQHTLVTSCITPKIANPPIFMNASDNFPPKTFADTLCTGYSSCIGTPDTL